MIVEHVGVGGGGYVIHEEGQSEILNSEVNDCRTCGGGFFLITHTYEKQHQIIQGYGLGRCWIRQVLLYYYCIEFVIPSLLIFSNIFRYDYQGIYILAPLL